MLEPRALRQAFGRFATGVTIVTCRDAQGQPVGLTVNSFASLSLEPPLVLWSLRTGSPSLAAFLAQPHFAINVLADSQVEYSRQFASRAEGRFLLPGWGAGLGGAPVLAGCTAVLECERVSQQQAGDHHLFIGRVLRLADSGVAPLLFHGGHYHLLGEIL